MSEVFDSATARQAVREGRGEATPPEAEVTPMEGATPGFDEGDDTEGLTFYDEDPYMRIKELNPDDFE
ncbi:hypothetical protein SAMN05421874_1497 [Nonomuraea maritima]|uniref:Uncharacterized protein n=1 Tax=Nonomuraea maritima TaxID=683260 RepID=A0A1G9RUU2_9ACTN|nr:hypothetical protein [Nonomuraea maritima]SDM26820.1 hypothetical protein SAMN05421874_1497 [Nonomuraea maritima]